jgi:formylglycine-generating enzyme required for sulfatase activity
MGSNPSRWVGDNNPVEQMGILAAMRYCNELSKLEGLQPCYTITGTTIEWDQKANGYRLPTNAEWEYAAKAGTNANTYAGENNGRNPNAMVDSIAWYQYNTQPGPPYDGSTASSRPVGGKRPNAWGLYDVLGNAAEWVYGNHDTYPSTPEIDPVYHPAPDNVIIRGGCFRNKADGILITERIRGSVTDIGDTSGFRVARNR